VTTQILGEVIHVDNQGAWPWRYAERGVVLGSRPGTRQDPGVEAICCTLVAVNPVVLKASELPTLLGKKLSSEAFAEAGYRRAS